MALELHGRTAEPEEALATPQATRQDRKRIKEVAQEGLIAGDGRPHALRPLPSYGSPNKHDSFKRRRSAPMRATVDART